MRSFRWPTLPESRPKGYSATVCRTRIAPVRNMIVNAGPAAPGLFVLTQFRETRFPLFPELLQPFGANTRTDFGRMRKCAGVQVTSSPSVLTGRGCLVRIVTPVVLNARTSSHCP